MAAHTRLHARSRGLTLIEIAVALALLALLASIAVPSFNAMIARQRLIAAAEQLVADFVEARFQAAQSGAALHVVLRPGADWCYAVARSADCDCRAADACQLRSVRAADVPGVELTAAADATFDPAGGSTGIGRAEWQGARNGHALQVSLTALGRARICTTSGLAGYSGC